LKKNAIFLLVALLLVFPGIVLSAQTISNDFIDINDHWAKPYIQLVTDWNLMNGTGIDDCGLRVFSPEDTVSRAELAKVLQRTFQFDYGSIRFIKQPLASDYYRDVDNNAWYADDLVMCSINNIFPVTNNYFLPDSSVSRVEIARSIYRAFNAKGISIPMIMMMPIYEDTNNLAQEDINAITFVSNTGIMKGDNNYFRPANYMTRGELTKVLCRCVDLIAVKEDLNGQEYKVKVGQNFYLSLNSNLSTGYTWSFKNSGDESKLASCGNTYLSNNTEEKIVGQGGRQYWQFKALQAGTTELQMVYARPWESVQPAQVFNVKIIVSEN
jgi:predicted secreted protein